MRDNIAVLASVAVFAAVLLVAIAALLVGNYIGCHARWEYSGYEVRYAPFKWCQINRGTWIPEKAFRDVE